jgi:cobalamin biosynthesis protein CbiD
VRIVTDWPLTVAVAVAIVEVGAVVGVAGGGVGVVPPEGLPVVVGLPQAAINITIRRALANMSRRFANIVLLLPMPRTSGHQDVYILMT